MDCVRIGPDSTADEIWRGKAKRELVFAPDIMAEIVEVPDDTVNLGDTWDGAAFHRPAPPPVTTIPGTTFLARVTDAEYQAVMAAAASNVQIARWIETLRLKGSVNTADADAQAAKAALVAAGLLTQARADTIFATS